MFNNIVSLWNDANMYKYFAVPPRCKLNMRSSGIFRSVEW